MRQGDAGRAWRTTIRGLPMSDTLAGVDMRLNSGGAREMRWHGASEMEPDGCGFLPVFDGDAFSEPVVGWVVLPFPVRETLASLLHCCDDGIGKEAMSLSAALEPVHRPVVALEAEFADGFVDPLHAHGRGQLLYASAGVMAVTTARGTVMVPPQRAMWLPAGTEHAVTCRGPVSLRTLYIEPGACAGLPDEVLVIAVATLVRALILEVMRFERDYDEAGREGRIVALLLDELGSGSEPEPDAVAMPDDPRLRRVCRAILRDPARGDDLDRWAALAGMGRRTLTRHFRRQTGLGLAEWRQQVRLAEAVARLEMGQSVTSVALDVGYESLSAFATAFQKRFGRSPSCFGGRFGGRLAH